MNNLAKKVDECLLNRGRRVYIACCNWDRENCPLYGVAGCPLFRGCLSIEVNGRTVGTFRIMGVCFSGVSIKTVHPPPFLRSHLSSSPMGVFSRDYGNYIYVTTFVARIHSPASYLSFPKYMHLFINTIQKFHLSTVCVRTLPRHHYYGKKSMDGWRYCTPEEFAQFQCS